MAFFLNLESKVAGLVSQMLVHQNKHAHQSNSIIQALSTLQTGTDAQDHPPSTSNNMETGSNNQSNSKAFGGRL